MNNQQTTYMDGRTFKVGTKVKFFAGGDWHTGKVSGFNTKNMHGATRVLVSPDQPGNLPRYMRWPLKDGAFYCSAESYGLGGGELEIIKN